MNGLITIELQQLHFYSYHGLFEEEKKIGNDFEVSLKVSYQSEKEIINEISDTVNYATLYDLVKEAMKIPTELLETVAMTITEKIHQTFSVVKKVEISILKLHPPIPQFVGAVGISYTKDF